MLYFCDGEEKCSNVEIRIAKLAEPHKLNRVVSVGDYTLQISVAESAFTSLV